MHVVAAALYTAGAVQIDNVNSTGAFFLLPTDACLWLGNVKFYIYTLFLVIFPPTMYWRLAISTNVSMCCNHDCRCFIGLFYTPG